MSNAGPETSESGARPSRRRGRRGARGDIPDATPAPAFVERRIPPYELLDEAQLDVLERHADWILSDIGVEVRGDPIVVELFAAAGARVDGERLTFEPGLLHTLCATAPRRLRMHARNPARTLEFGGDALIFAPAYGPRFVTDLERGRRYATIEDFETFIKLTYTLPALHYQSGTICEPVDVAVNKRHLDMVYAHLRYSDKPFMRSVTSPEGAEDSIAMARLVFGEAFMREHLVIHGNINVNSPLVYDDTMTGALRVYAAANQGTVISPFILGGAMSPVTTAATVAQAHAEALVGIAVTQLVRPGAPVVYGSFLTTMDLKTGASTFGTPESSLACFAIAQLCRRLGLPFCCGGHLTGAKSADAQAMMKSVSTMSPALLAGANFIFQAAGWLEGGLTIGYEKFVMDADPCEAHARLAGGLELDDEALAADACLESGIGGNFPGVAHTLRNFRTANVRSAPTDNQSFEKWTEEGATDMQQRAHLRWNQLLANYDPPPLEPSVDDALRAFVAEKKAASEDRWH